MNIFIKRNLSLEQAQMLGEKMEYALIYELSEVKLYGKRELTSGFKLDKNELLEARFFSDSEEVHIFPIDGQLQGILVSETENQEFDDSLSCHIIDETYPLNSKFREVGKSFRVRRYLAFDEDGQVYPALTRLLTIEGGKN